MHIRSLLLVPLLLAFGTASTSGQMVYVVFKDRKIEKRYAQYLTRLNGVDGVIGEAKKGITFNGPQVKYTGGAEALNELWVADPGAPDLVPYVWDGKGHQVPSKKKGKGGVISIPGDDIQGVKVVDRLATLQSFAGEYIQRMADVSALEQNQKLIKPGDREWFLLNGRILGQQLRLQNWLSNLGFARAATDLGKEIDKRRKSLAKDAASVREKEALASIHPVANPPELAEVAKAIGQNLAFHIQESRHARITYISGIADARVTAALELAEKIADGFRREFVDPYLDDDFPDMIPAQGPLVELYFGPPDLKAHEHFLTDYYKQPWGRHKEQEMAASGALFYRQEAPYYLHYRKSLDDIDLEGYVAHAIGSAFADLHYNSGRRNDAQPWLTEAAGYYVAVNWLGRNSITSFSDGIEQYAKAKQENGVKTAKTGLRGYYNETARKLGATLEATAPKELYQLTDADFCKGWSFFEFVAKKLGRDGQLWLRRTCDCAADRPSFMTTWRKASEALYPVEPGADVFAKMDAQWRHFAETEQIAEVDPTR